MGQAAVRALLEEIGGAHSADAASAASAPLYSEFVFLPELVVAGIDRSRTRCLTGPPAIAPPGGREGRIPDLRVICRADKSGRLFFYG